MPRTLADRLTWRLVGIAVAALAAVVVTVSATVSAFLVRRTDQLLAGLAERAARGLGDTAEGELDYGAAQHELDDLRPPGVRLELRGPDDDLRIGIGPIFDLSGAGAGPGCASRGALRLCVQPRGELVVLAARDRQDELAARDELLGVLAVTAVLVAAAVALLGRLAARQAARPLARLAERVAALQPGSGARVEAPGEIAEVDLLARRFDDLARRFEEAMAREKRFAAEASHELRTPLTIARGEIEALADGSGEAGRALAALDKLGALVDRLLWFARAQARLDDERAQVVNLADLVRGELGAVTRGHPGRKIVTDLPDEALVRGDEHLLARAVANLVDNAVRHGAEGPIGARLVVDERQLTLRLVNEGAAIPASRRQLVFEPFVRAAAGSTAGFGLGLPFVRAVARAHGGDVALAERDAGTEVVVHLPLATSV